MCSDGKDTKHSKSWLGREFKEARLGNKRLQPR
jgi:hypothetical protein